MYLPFNPYSPGWALDFHVTVPPPCLFAGAVSSLLTRLTGAPVIPGERKALGGSPALLSTGRIFFPSLWSSSQGLEGMMTFARSCWFSWWMHEAGSRAQGQSCMGGYIGPVGLSSEIIKTFFFSFLSLLSVNEADPLPGWHRVGRDVYWQGAWIYIFLNYDEFFSTESVFWPVSHVDTFIICSSISWSRFGFLFQT